MPASSVHNRVTPGDIAPPVNEMACHSNILPSRRGTLNALKRSKVAGLDVLSAELFTAPPAVFADLLLPLVRESWKSQRLERRVLEGVSVSDNRF